MIDQKVVHSPKGPGEYPQGVQRVVFEHYRLPAGFYQPAGRPAPDWLFHYRKGLDRWEPGQNGGLTRCVVLLANGSRCVGEAWCSLADPFCYRTGRDLAYTRALLNWVKEG